MLPALSWRRAFFLRIVGIGLAPLIWGLLAGCSGQAPGGPAPDSFVPPTAASEVSSPLLIQATPTPTGLPRELRPSPTPACTDILSFLEDVSIPDGTVFRPGESLDKRWRVENSGSCNWDDRYRLRLISGPDLGAIPEQALYPARSGAQIELRIVFTSPAEPGTYRSAWQAHDPQGRPFGDPFYIEIVVEAQSP
jgi:hypothetical protein